MNNLPQVYRKYDLLFTPRLIPQLRNLRGETWAALIDKLTKLPENHPDSLAFSIMMIELGGCLPCEMDSYRAQRGCAMCARQTIISFKGNENQLLQSYENARQIVAEYFSEESELRQVA
jgi:hypothetical protein